MTETRTWVAWLTPAVVFGGLLVVARSALPDDAPIFWHLIRYDGAAAMITLLAMPVAALAVRADDARLAETAAAVGRRTSLVALLAAVGTFAVSLLAYRGPLAMDEIAPVVQAEAFARGELTGHVPPSVIARAMPHAGYFYDVAPDGRFVSTYWPGLALLLTPFAASGVPTLLNAIVTAATIAATAAIARREWPESPDEAAGWAALLSVASPVLWIDGAGTYAMPAHLLATLVWTALVARRTATADALAAQVGAYAFALHNPFPHLAVVGSAALTGWRTPGRWLRMALAYVPLSVLLLFGWMHVRAGLRDPDALAPSTLAASAFAPPTLGLLVARAFGLAKLDAWGAPGLIGIALLAPRDAKRTISRALLAAAAATFALYLFVPFDQGHGWGFRYLHTEWSVLPLLAAGAAVTRPGATRRLAAASVVVGLTISLPVRVFQVAQFMDRHYAQVPTGASCPEGEVVFLDVDHGYYAADLVRNDVDFRGPRWILRSEGPEADRAFVHGLFPEATSADPGHLGTRFCVPSRTWPR